MQKRKKKGSRYLRVGTFDLEEVLPYVFTRKKRHQLRKKGISYKHKEWIKASRKLYTVIIKGKEIEIAVTMGSHRYQLFAEKGVKCVMCGICGKFFALERGYKDNPNRYHFNLYGEDEQGNEIMITKDHIIPRSKGGKNRLTNYQPMCYSCNNKKSNKVINVTSTN